MFRILCTALACALTLGIMACEDTSSANTDAAPDTAAKEAPKKEDKPESAASGGSEVCQAYFRMFATCQAFPQSARAAMQANINQWKLALQSADDERKKLLEKSCKQAMEGLEIAGCE